MSKVTMQDVRKRISYMQEGAATTSSATLRMYEKALETGSAQMIESCLNRWQTLHSDRNLAATMVIELFDKACETCNESIIIKFCNMICEETAPKVRDGKQTQTLINHKIGKFKTKLSTKINNNVQDAKDAVKNALSSAKKNLDNNVQKMKDNAEKGGIKKPSSTPEKGDDTKPDTTPAKDNKEEKKEETVKECYIKILEAFDKYAACDRLLENYNKLSKRFNIDKLIVENAYQDIYDTTCQICEMVDTYNIPYKAKISISLECSMYALDKHAIPFDRKRLVEACTDYFLMNMPINEGKDNKEKSCVYTMADALKDNRFIDLEDFEDMHHITAKDADIQFDHFFDRENSTYSTPIFSNRKEAEADLMSENAYYMSNYILEKKKLDIDLKKKANEVKKLIDDFKASADKKTPEGLKALVRKIYTKSADNIIEETPNFLNWIRVFFVFGSFALNPILGAVVIFTDAFIAMSMKRKETKKMLDYYIKERDKAKTKLEKLKEDGEARKRCEEYIKTLDKSIEKIERYYESLHTEEENDERTMNSTDTDTGSDSSGGDDDFGDFNFGDDDFDVSLDEASLQNLSFISLILEDIEYLKDVDKDVILGDTSQNLDKMRYDDIDAITDFALASPMLVIDPEALKECFEDKIDYLRKNRFGIASFMQTDCLNENLYKISDVKIKEERSSLSIYQEYSKLHALKKGVEAIREMNSLYAQMNPINEAGFINAVKMASIKLQKAAQSLSDKEKAVSKNIDVSMNNLTKSVEKALTNDNRESVIKGSIIPQASKVIKTAIATGVAWAINPAIAVIGLLGSMAVSKKFQAKERQLILDEIEIELKMVEKYIKIAEDKEDMKALKQLLNTQRTLERERQRIKYHMVTHHQRTPEVQDSDD